MLGKTAGPAAPALLPQGSRVGISLRSSGQATQDTGLNVFKFI